MNFFNGTAIENGSVSHFRNKAHLAARPAAKPIGPPFRFADPA
jgi:hypothetical protein